MTYTPSPQKTRSLVPRQYLSPFGNKLIQAGYAAPEQMQQALAETRKTGRTLVEALELLTGRQLPADLIRQYKKHELFELKILYGVESLDAELEDINRLEMVELIETLIPIDICRRYQLFPIAKQQGEVPALLVAMVDPENLEATDELNRLLRYRGMRLQRLVLTPEDYDRLLEDYHQIQREKSDQAEKAKARDLTSLVQTLTTDFLPVTSEEGSEDLGTEEAQAAPIINLVNRILSRALAEEASDIHIETQEETLRVRLRRDGVLQIIESLPKQIAPAIIARFKIMADLDIAERRLPQDGKIRRVYKGNKIDFRVSTLPSRFGEKVVLRILDNSTTQIGLDKLITDQSTLELLQNAVRKPYGLVLVTGPTGSGKSTTLYSMLAERNNPEININTVEDPIEYSLPGITQVQVLREKGMDFASILRSFLRQDPDVILVGETRDKETAKTVIEAALTGHLVLTTLHTNDAAGAIARLDEMGVEPFMISGSLLGILAQRLMRRVCTECRQAYHPTAAELARFGLSAANLSEIVLYRAKSLPAEDINRGNYGEIGAKRGNVCRECHGTGYKGRIGVYEFLRNSDRIQKLINERANTEQIKEAAVEEGMTTLLAYSLKLVEEGYTTLEEVERVTFTDTSLEAELKAKRKSSLQCRTCSAELMPEWLDCPYCLTPRFS